MNSDRLYSVLAEPHISEKVSVVGEQSNQYAFKVASDATKHEIKRAVETIFKVSVKNVTTVNVKGKIKRTFRGMSRSRNWKKAYVRVADGQDIDFTEGAA
ncbi:MAG: 50S ribosomal protein L23 [Pseudomonadales bacterium]